MGSAYPTEIAGQYGSCLTDFLLVKNYEADGFIRRSSTLNTYTPLLTMMAMSLIADLFLGWGDLIA